MNDGKMLDIVLAFTLAMDELVYLYNGVLLATKLFYTSGSASPSTMTAVDP